MASNKIDTNGVLIVGGLVVAYLIISKVGGGLSSLFPSSTPAPSLDKQNDVLKKKAGQLNAKDYTYTISQYDADNLAATIYDALGYFADDFETVLGAIKECQTLGDVAEVNLSFHNSYNIDLWTYLQNGKAMLPNNGLDGDQMTQINDYINSLPS